MNSLIMDGETDALFSNDSLSQDNDTTDSNCFHILNNITDVERLQVFICYAVLLNLIGVFGILGNLVSIIILSRPQMKSSINFLLIGLANSDTILIIISILLFGLYGIYPYTGFLYNYVFTAYPVMTKYLFPLAMTAQTTSVYLTITVTLERFVAVCHPLRARSLCTYGRARWYVIFIFLFSFLYNIPRFQEVEVVSDFDVDRNRTVWCFVASDLRNHELYITMYCHWAYLFVNFFFPFVTLAFLNVCIYKQVRKANAERQRLSRIQRREIGLATMLMIVVAVFFICNILPLIANTIEAIYNNEFPELSYIVPISNLLVTVNSSVNFIIYVIFGEKFKRLFFKIFCSHKFMMVAGRESPDGTHDDSLISNGENRYSLRLHRQNTASTRVNGNSVRYNGADRRSIKVSRAPSPGPIVYYPRNNRNHTYTTTLATSTEWDNLGTAGTEF